MERYLNSCLQYIDTLPDYTIFGKIKSIKGLTIEVLGLDNFVTIGSKCKIYTKNQKEIMAEVLSLKLDTAILVPYSDTEGIGIGCKVELINTSLCVFPDDSWLGRVIDANANSIDDNGPLIQGTKAYELKNSPPLASKRQRIGKKLDLGVKALNCFTSCCIGQRMGIFAGSGVGKSVLISMLCKYASSDIKIVGLIGERGREVQEFIQDYLGEIGLKNTIVVVSTSDESAILRKQAAYLTMSLAEYFRDQGKQVLCIIDNVTRFAMAMREIGLIIGEPPSSKGYTPSVFSELPKLLERSGPGVENSGSITAFFAVLVEGDDHNEPICDAVRGIIDGHIVLERSIAEKGRFPAINISKSISRTMPGCNNDDENNLISKAKKIIATYEDMIDMIRLGAYKKGNDLEVDIAIQYYPAIEKFLSQKPTEYIPLEESYKNLAEILNHVI